MTLDRNSSTDRLYYTDCYLSDFEAQVLEIADGGRRVYLDRTAFYPTSGGQSFDLGTLAGIPLVDVIDEDERIAHVLASPLPAEVSATVACEVDWARRYDHMQQHSGQHLISAVFEHLFQAPTVSVHMGEESSTVELGVAALKPGQIEAVEERCAELVAEAWPLNIRFEENTADLGLRKQSARQGTLRVVTIGDPQLSSGKPFDTSACGGTHVRSTAELGPILLRKQEKVRANIRVEFLCGLRALRQARADFRTLEEIARAFSATPDKTPSLVAAALEKGKTLEKSVQRLAGELAKREGQELWTATPVGPDGLRRATQRGAIDEATRVRAQAFTASGNAVFLALCDDPASILMAASADSGINAGALVKAAVTAAGGRGGGGATLGQGSVPAGTDLDSLARPCMAASRS